MNIQIILANYNEIDPEIPEGGQLQSPAEILARYFLLTDWVHGLRRAGLMVDVFLRSRTPHEFQDGGATYHFVPDRSPARTYLYLPLEMHRKIAALAGNRKKAGYPVLVHVNGLLFPLQVRLLRGALGPATPILAQHHGSLPWAPGLRRLIQRWGLAPLDGFLFASRSLAAPWTAAGLIPSDRVHEVMELTSHFNLVERQAARRRTGLVGDPVVFWAGNLDENKDPLTILAGFEGFLRRYPAARLYMAYRTDGLLAQVQAFIEVRPALKSATTLLGCIPYRQIQPYFNSADLFVQGSAKEGSGLALMDALACGVLPVVTDIPAFRAILKNGQLGFLWQVGSVPAFLAALERAMQDPPRPREIRAFFDRHWHADLIAQQAVSVYRKLAAAG